MNWIAITLLSTVVVGDILGSEIQTSGKAMTFKQKSEDLNIEHIISLWNKSVTEDPVTNAWVTTLRSNEPSKESTTRHRINAVRLKETIPDNFPSRFTNCLKKNKQISNDYPDQKTIIRCLKVELITKLNALMITPSQNIRLFNGYLEFQKLENQDTEVADNEITKGDNDVVTGKSQPTRRYSSKVTVVRPEETEQSSSDPFVEIPLKQPKVHQSHATEYYENYKKMLRELVARKSGAELSRKKREESKLNSQTLQKSARLFANGRKLFSEITNNLENDEEQVESLTEAILDPELVSSINNFTKAYSLRLNFYPGIAARMTRNENSGVTFDLELDDVNEVEEEVPIANNTDDGGRGGKKKKGTKKISKKTLKKLFPYLLIPFMIQAALLPIVLKFLLFVAIKALIAGKLALILVAFNAIRNASQKTDEDEYIERMSYEHYGYGGGEEYGAWINRRQFTIPESEEARDTDSDKVADPYAAYRPDKM